MDKGRANLEETLAQLQTCADVGIGVAQHRVDSMLTPLENMAKNATVSCRKVDHIIFTASGGSPGADKKFVQEVSQLAPPLVSRSLEANVKKARLAVKEMARQQDKQPLLDRKTTMITYCTLLLWPSPQYVPEVSAGTGNEGPVARHRQNCG